MFLWTRDKKWPLNFHRRRLQFICNSISTPAAFGTLLWYAQKSNHFPWVRLTFCSEPMSLKYFPHLIVYAQTELAGQWFSYLCTLIASLLLCEIILYMTQIHISFRVTVTFYYLPNDTCLWHIHRHGWGYKNGLMVTSTRYTCRGLECGSQHPC